jgi:hypothetical protein
LFHINPAVFCSLDRVDASSVDHTASQLALAAPARTMRTAVFLACALGATPVAATASGNPLANLVLTLTRDVLDAAFNAAAIDGASLSVRPLPLATCAPTPPALSL